jgi:hypothetical protein
MFDPKVSERPLKFLCVRYLDPGKIPSVKVEVAREQVIYCTPRVRTDQEITGNPGTPPAPRGNGARP